jgi:hypothetical protein
MTADEDGEPLPMRLSRSSVARISSADELGCATIGKSVRGFAIGVGLLE